MMGRHPTGSHFQTVEHARGRSHPLAPAVVLMLVLGAFSIQPAAAQTAATRPAVVEKLWPAYVPSGQTIRYEQDVKSFLDADRTAPPPRDGILFIGSSIFRQWEQLSDQMAPLPVYNRAFGGSRTWELLHYVDQIVIPYAPRFVVYYCGSNDVNAKQDAAGITERTIAFFDRVHRALPNTQLFYVDIQKAPDKRAKWAIVDSTNAAMRRYSAEHVGWVHTIDLNPVLFDASGNIRGELFKPDSLHFLQPVYLEFTRLVKPALEKVWAKP